MFNPKYTLTDEILKNISYISEVKHFIETAKIIPVSEIKLQRMALIRMSQGSTAIEGNILNQKQVENILADKKIDAPNRDVFEVKNYLSALKYIGTFVKKNRKLSTTSNLAP
jgi:Fic family protein